MENESKLSRFRKLAKRELEMARHRPLFVFCILVAPIFFCFMFTSLMKEGAPAKLPAALVDEDNTGVTRTLIRTLDAMQECNITTKYATFTEAREAVQRGEVYVILHIPRGSTRKALTSKQPIIYCYTNEAYLLAGSFLFKDLKLIGELSGLALTRETLLSKGLTSDQTMAVIQPIQLETHPLKNSKLNYSIYLSSMILPAIFLLMVLICTSYSIGLEWKRGTQKQWYSDAGMSVPMAIVGKLWPQTVLFMLVFMFMDVYLYKFLGFILSCPMWRLWLVQLLTIISCQALAVFIFGLFAGMMRFAMSVCSLFGVLSISLSGFTFPVMGMPLSMQALAEFLPLRQYFLIYVNQVLNGFDIIYCWKSFAWLLLWPLVATLFFPRFRVAFLKIKYLP